MQGMVDGVTTKSGVSQKNGKAWTLYMVSIGGESYSTFDAKLYSQAMALQGQMVEFSYNERQNGAYVNYDLTGISAGNGAAVQPSVAPLAKPVPQTQDTKSHEIAKAVVFKEACAMVAARNAPKAAYSNDDVAKDVQKLSELFWGILRDIGKSPAAVAEEVFEATPSDQEPPI